MVTANLDHKRKHNVVVGLRAALIWRLKSAKLNVKNQSQRMESQGVVCGAEYVAECGQVNWLKQRKLQTVPIQGWDVLNAMSPSVLMVGNQAMPDILVLMWLNELIFTCWDILFSLHFDVQLLFFSKIALELNSWSCYIILTFYLSRKHSGVHNTIRIDIVFLLWLC